MEVKGKVAVIVEVVKKSRGEVKVEVLRKGGVVEVNMRWWLK